MTYKDASGVNWQVREIFDDRLVYGVLVFQKGDESRVTMGSPIDWRSPRNLTALFDLAMPV